MSRVSLNTLVFAAALAGIAPTAALAQEPAVPSEGGLGEIIVTARRAGENLQNTPISISTISAEALEQRALTSPVELNRTTPSLNLVQSATSPMGLQMNMRGQVATDTAAFSSSSVGIYMDDVFLGGAGISGGLMNFDDLQRVEVLKGPQGTLYGRNVTGGVVRFITNEPSTDEFEAYLKAGVGNYDRRHGSGMVNIPLSDYAAFRLVGSYENHEGYSYDVRSNRELDDLEMWNTRAQFLVRPSQNFEVLVQAWYGEGSNSGADQRITYFQPGLTTAAMNIMVAEGFNGINAGTLAPLIFGTAGGFTQPQVDAALASALAALPQVTEFVEESQNAPRDQSIGDPNYPQHTYTQVEGVSLALTWDFDNLTLKSITAYSGSATDRGFNVGGFPVTPIFTEQQGENTQWTQEFQANGAAFDDRLKFALGTYYLRSEITDARNQSSRDGAFPYLLGQLGLGVTSGSITENEAEVISNAFYGQMTYALTDTVNITGGLRYTDESMSTLSNGIQTPNLQTGGQTICIGPAPSTATTPVDECAQPASSNFTNWTYTAGVDWSVTPDLMVYLKTSRGFKAGGVNVFASQYAPITSFAPEENTDIEVGFKSEWFDSRFRLNFAYYQTDYQDIQRTVAFQVRPGLIVTAIQNAASAKIDGAELETQWLPFEGMTLSATAAWTDPRYEEYPVFNATYPNNTKDQSGLPFQSNAEWTYSVGASYDFIVAGADVNAQLNWSWRDDAVLFENDLLPSTFGGTDFVPKQYLTQEAYGLLDGAISIELDGLNSTLSIWGKNLTDEEYFSSMVSLVNNGVGSGWANYGAPRTFGVDLKVRF